MADPKFPTIPNESAYPLLEFNVNLNQLDLIQAGMTKREYFAAMVMQGITANPGACGVPDNQAAKISVERADALIEALNKQP